MLDMSRNAVMKPEEVKKFAATIKKLGYNMIQLYTEDTYEVPGEPYFGYLRGRYSQAELKNMVKYCDSIGVELLPYNGKGAAATDDMIPSVPNWGVTVSPNRI